MLEVDISTELSGIDAVKQADITFFSVPISQTTQVIQDLAPHAKAGSLLADFTSIKSPALDALKQHTPAECEFMGLHPMFGPQGVTNMESQVIAVCEGRSGKWSTWLIDFFESQGANVKYTSSAEHDQMMSVVQGLTHLSSIATAMALKELQFDVKESLEFSSPIYKLRLEMVGRILSQSPQLYAEIAIKNPLTKSSLTAYSNSIQKLMQTVSEQDEDGFIAYFKEAADHLGDFKEDAYRRTSQLIEQSKSLL